jgi:hypothetical protein
MVSLGAQRGDVNPAFDLFNWAIRFRFCFFCRKKGTFWLIKLASSISGVVHHTTGSRRKQPSILAVADFHKPGNFDEPGSMTYTQSALWPYLYGHRVQWELVDGQLRINAIKKSLAHLSEKGRSLGVL